MERKYFYDKNTKTDFFYYLESDFDKLEEDYNELYSILSFVYDKYLFKSDTPVDLIQEIEKALSKCT